ncbi:serine/threonine-protein kinase [Streptomyces showdoensis]|uniref:serine/threonine-protein kinase n=1 Tax=Streptomyces showdoensis TaxID=68268 RepID=UPI00196A04AF|nr:serine/threonine-protein kinase [Streptomyces showdoensis]
MSAQPPGAQPARTALSPDDPREIGGYRLHARLGAGGMGVVYLAYTPGGRPIALKAVREEFAADPEFRERFAQEVASARRIHGLFTAQVVDYGVDARTPWLATAYVPGPTLQQVVQRHGPLPVRTVLPLVAGIAEALQGIHGVGVVHRDLKPANVLIAADGPRVIDFGIARAADEAALTGTGLRIGTAAYMAPEQALGHPVTPATDVFALGALAAYVSCGTAPFGNGPEAAALYRVVHEGPDLGRVPAGLRELIGHCLAKNPQDRPTTVELIAAVHAHPAVGPRPGFADDWLPHPVSDDIEGYGAGPTPPPLPAPGPASAPTPFPTPTHVQATVTASAATPYGRPHPRGDGTGTGSTGTGAPGPLPADGSRASRRAPRRGRRLLVTALVALLALLAGGAVVSYLDHPPEEGTGAGTAGSSGAPSVRPTAPSAAAGYAPAYANTELTSPDASYEFDLRAGKVVPEETAAWYLARNAGAFVVSEESDAFIAAGDDLSVADCVKGIETQPVTTLPFAELADERPFCVRSADQKDVAIVRLVEAAAGGGSVTVTVDRHHREG